MIGAPPPRYRVVERGRRLIVIDTATGAPASDRRIAEPAAPLGPERIAFDGRSTLVTRYWYDDKAPRRLTLDEGTTRWLDGVRTLAIGAAVLAAVLIVFMPWLAVAAVPVVAGLARAEGRAGLRRRITRWLDRFDA